MSKQSGSPDEKKEAHHAPAHQEQKVSAKAHHVAPGGCLSYGCKASAKRFNFCDEHYEHFKFGLIKKTGEPVPDYEKKFGHYKAWVAKRNAPKVA
jgi:hypothetical protein